MADVSLLFLLTLGVVLITPLCWAIFRLVEIDPYFQFLKRKIELFSIRELTLEHLSQVDAIDQELSQASSKLTMCRVKLLNAQASVEDYRIKLEKIECDSFKNAIPEAKEILEKRNAKKEFVQSSIDAQLGEVEHCTDERDYLESIVSSLTSKRQAVIATGMAQHRLKKNSSNGSLEVIERMEAKVVMKENRVTESMEKRLTPEVTTSPNKIDDKTIISEDLDMMLSKVRDASVWLQQVSANVITADPSIERAYERLCKKFEQAHQHARASLRSEEKLISFVTMMIASLQKILEDDFNRTLKEKSFAECPEDFDTNELNYTKMASPAMLQLLEVIAHVSQAVKGSRRANFSIDQRLFFVEEIVRRLYVSKLLLSALPSTLKNEILQFRSVIVQVCRFLSLLSISSDKSLESAEHDILKRVTNLEEHCLMAYIEIAKGNRSIPVSVCSRFSFDMSSALAALDVKLSELPTNLERWNESAQALTASGNEFAASVASGRHGTYVKVAELITRSADVLSVTIAALEKIQSEEGRKTVI